MKIIDIIRLLRKHLVLLLAVPVLLGALVTYMTRKPNYIFTSQTTLYTGLATGLTVEMDKTFNYAATNAAFDNLMNIIKSRETLQEVSIRLLSQHLMLDKPDPKFISALSYSELKRITPAYIYKLIRVSGTTDIKPGTEVVKKAKDPAKPKDKIVNASGIYSLFRVINEQGSNETNGEKSNSAYDSEYRFQGKNWWDPTAEINVNPRVPDGLVYLIQIAVFSNPVKPSYFKGLVPVYGFKVSGTEKTEYRAGLFRKSSDARKALTEIKKKGFSDAFIVAIAENRKIPASEAKLLEKDWGGKPLFAENVEVLLQESDTSDVTPESADKSDLFRTVNASVYRNSEAKTGSNLFPSSISPADYEETVRNLTDLMKSSDTNFVYRLLNYTHPHYSFNSMSAVRVQRMFSSDLLKLDYQSDDPGICQQTLAILNEVCIKNYKQIKENRSDAVVKYFEKQLGISAGKLNQSEDKLLNFNMNNNIINYYEQSKAVAMVKEELDKSYNNKKVEIAGLDASIKRLEEKMGAQQQIQLKSSSMVEKKNKLGELSYQIALAESLGMADEKAIQNLSDQKYNSEKLKDEIRKEVEELYRYGNSVEGVPFKDLISDWLAKTIAAEDAKASLKVMNENYKEFLKQYSIYAPAGANLKRIEREISTSESEFLEILHGLNLANLKLQDNEFSSNIKAVDPPYFPLSPIPTKRKILILAAFLVGFMMVLTIILAMEYLDNTLKNPSKASRILKIPFLGVIPKILLRPQTSNLPFVMNRMQEVAVQNIDLHLKTAESGKTTHTLLIFSNMKMEGKTVVAAGLARKLTKLGKSVLFLNYSGLSLNKFETEQTDSQSSGMENETYARTKKQKPFPFISRLLGYPDPRIDYYSPFLDEPENVLKSGHYHLYNISDSFYDSKSYTEILEQNNLTISYIPDYVIIEVPPVLHYPYPAELLSKSDLTIMVCRSNRNWSDADQTVIDAFTQITCKKIHFILNGVELVAVESIMGELPKNRSKLRQKMKNVFRFQFFSQNQI